MLHSLLQTTINFLHNHPHAAGIITFFIAFSEALAIVGTIVPGSVTLTAIGVMVGSKVLPITSTLVYAALGAILGDFISYWVGTYYKDHIHKIWPFSRYPNWLARGETFVKKHGGKSIIIGRFFGPARSLVPLIAGALGLPLIRFTLAAIPSASIWAISYMLPGIFLGALSLELPKELALEFIGLVLILIFLAVLITWLIRYFCEYLTTNIDQRTLQLWQLLQNNHKTRWLTKILTNPRNPENHGQLILLIYVLIFGLLFLLLTVGIYLKGSTFFLDKPIFNLLCSLRTNLGDNIALFLTIIGEIKTSLIATGLILGWFVYKKYIRAALHWIGLAFLTLAGIQFFKLLIALPRPQIVIQAVKHTTLSFPSGHTCLTVSLLGFLAALIAPELKLNRRYLPYLAVALIASLVGLSRLFLGAHWLTDVLGGLLLGIILVLVVTISYRRDHTPYIPLGQFIIVIILAFGIGFGIEALSFKQLKQDYTISWPVYLNNISNWKNQQIQDIPLYRTNRFGKPIDIFNLQWLGNVETIKINLLEQGWENYLTKPSFSEIVSRVTNNHATNFHLPLVPQLYRNQYPVLFMSKTIEIGDAQGINNHQPIKKIIVLRLWKSGIFIQNYADELLIGTVSYYQPPQEYLLKHIPIKNGEFVGAVNAFIEYLTNFRWREVVCPFENQSPALQRLHWDGRLLMIY